MRSVFSTKIIVYILRIIIGVIIARKLGPEGKGIIAAVVVIPETFSAFGHLGLPISNVFFIAKGGDKQKMLANSVIFTLASSTVYIIIGIGLIPVFSSSYFMGVGLPFILLVYFQFLILT